MRIPPRRTLAPGAAIVSDFDLAILLSSFEPVQDAHCAAIALGTARAGRVLALVGSATAARTLRHPWSAKERIAMLRAAVPDADLLMIAAVPDRLYDEAGWRDALHATVTAAAGAARRIAWLQPAGVQAAPPGPWTPLAVPGTRAGSFWDLRRAVFADRSDALDRLDPVLPATTRTFLGGYRSSPHFPALAEELRHIERFRESWRVAPYPPVLVTTDALVVHAGRLLLVRRGHAPGKGLWALPGGFIEQDETLLEGCVRELHEETGLVLTADQVQRSLRRQHVFDAPRRSLRGRTITHCFRFDLSDEQPRAVAGGDDAADARWIGLEAFAGMEAQMFEDHFHIARCMLA